MVRGEMMIEQTRATLKKYWTVEDLVPVDIVLGAAVASYLGSRLWLRVTGASRSGKTKILEAIGEYPDFFSLDSLTPASIRGGLKGGGSLDELMNGKKLLIIKDFASFSKMNRNKKAELWALLRVVSDGEVKALYGSDAKLVRRTYDFNILMGMVKGTVDRVMEAQLGQRFIDMNWVIASPRKVQKQIRLNKKRYGENYEKELLVPEFRDAVAKLIIASKGIMVNNIIPEVNEKIGLLALQVAALRGGVPRDSDHNVIDAAQIEVPSTLTSNFLTLAKGICMTRAQDTIDWTVYKEILRVAKDCIPSRRQMILREVLQGNKKKTKIINNTGIAKTLVDREVEDLKLLKVPDTLNTTGLANALINGRIWKDKSKPLNLDLEDE